MKKYITIFGNDIYVYTKAKKNLKRGGNYFLKYSFQVLMYLTCIGCRVHQKLPLNNAKNLIKACYCLIQSFRLTHSLRVKHGAFNRLKIIFYFLFVFPCNVFSQSNNSKNYEIAFVSLSKQSNLLYLDDRNYISMPITITFSIEKAAKVLAVAVDITGVIIFFNFATGWTVNDFLCNPYSKALIFAILGTVLIFTVPNKYRKSKNKVIAIILISVIGLLIILTFIFFPKGNCNTKSIIFSPPIHVNKDTVAKGANISNKKDTVTQKETNVRPAKKAKITTSQKDSTSATKGSKYNIEKPVFNAPSQIGDNNTQNVGIQPRKIDTKLIDDFESYFTDKNIHVSFMNHGNMDGESVNVRDQIINMLRQRGYKNVSEFFGSNFGGEFPKEIQFVKSDNGEAIFLIPPPLK